MSEKPVGFYTDEKRRVRPITKPKGRYKEPPMKVHRVGIRTEYLSRGLKGFTVTFTYKDKVKQEVPIVARSYREALEGACVKIETDKDRVHNLEDVDELRIVDPSIGEVLKKIGAGARKAVTTTARTGKAFVTKTAEVAGEIKATPQALREAYQYGKERGRYVPPEKRAVAVPSEPSTPRWDRKEIMRLVDQTKSSDVTVRVTAIGYLKRFYPEVYEELHFERTKMVAKSLR